MDLPLEISANEFTTIQNSDQLRQMVDESGWSRSDSLHRVTWLRLRTEYLKICGDVLEISLGNPLEFNELAARANAINHRIHLWGESFPAKVRAHVDMALGSLRTPSTLALSDPEIRSNFINAIAVHIRKPQARYFLLRTVYSQTLIMSEEIISTAKEILDFTLELEKTKSLFQDWPSDIAAMVCGGTKLYFRKRQS
jgi:hypothetical protein